MCIRQIVVDSSVPVLLLFLGSGGSSLPLLPTATFCFTDFGLTVLHRLTVLQEPSSPHPPTLIFFYQASTQCLNPVYFASAGTALAALHGKTGSTEIFRQTGDSHRLSTSRNKNPNAALRVASHTAPSLTDLFPQSCSLRHQTAASSLSGSGSKRFQLVFSVFLCKPGFHSRLTYSRFTLDAQQSGVRHGCSEAQFISSSIHDSLVYGMK